MVAGQQFYSSIHQTYDCVDRYYINIGFGCRTSVLSDKNYALLWPSRKYTRWRDYRDFYKIAFFFQEINFYAQTIANCIESTKHQLVIFIDSIDEAQNLVNMEWMPTKLNENIKFIITVTSKATSIDDISNEDTALLGLKNKINDANFIYLNQFSSEQWKDVLSSGGGDFYATSGALYLPEAWFNSTDKLPLQAKVALNSIWYHIIYRI